MSKKREPEKPEVIAARLTRKEYLTLRNTIRVLRFAGASLNAAQEKRIEEYKAVVKAYEEKHA